MGLREAGLTVLCTPLWVTLPQFLRWLVPSWKVLGTLLLCPALRRGWGPGHRRAQLQSHVYGPDGEELWARVETELVSFPPTMARIGPRALNREGCE